ncbi:hypothetical protein [Nocardioides sp. L-11A]|uniref:hypothetical protein n=1 Tax=Nocardioides sp. L-11A TaxID=3043848 RepID=UPI00249B8F6D|nr:hypothetical protein QJ852_22225 [Nocardioides sp. L-11A]
MVTTSGESTANVRDRRSLRSLFTYEAPDGFEIRDVFLEPPHLMVVNSDPTDEQGDRPVVIDLESHAERDLSAVTPRIWSGGWSLRAGRVTYGARDSRDRYCLAETTLDSTEGAMVECVPPRHGFHQAGQSPYGIGYARFDDRRPASCGTARTQRKAEAVTDVPGPTACKVWDVLPLKGDGAVWGEVPKPRQIEVSEIKYRLPGGAVESLGYGTTGSLTWCGDSAWFLRQMEGRLMRWDPERGLEEALRLPDTDRVAVLSAPVCSGDFIAVFESRERKRAGTDEVVHTTRLHPTP